MSVAEGGLMITVPGSLTEGQVGQLKRKWDAMPRPSNWKPRLIGAWKVLRGEMVARTKETSGNYTLWVNGRAVKWGQFTTTRAS